MRRPNLLCGRCAPRLHPSLHAAGRLRGPGLPLLWGAPFATLSSLGFGFEGRRAPSRLLLPYRSPGGPLASEPSTTSATYPFLALSSAACLCVSGWATRPDTCPLAVTCWGHRGGAAAQGFYFLGEG